MNDATSANWYPDPDMPSRLRYWDGVTWTPHYALMPPVPAETTESLEVRHDPAREDSPFTAPSNLLTTSASDEGWRHVPPMGAPIGSPSKAAVNGLSRRRPLRAGEVLTGLGAFALVAAGFAFLRSVWSGLGTGGQIAVLLSIVLVQAAASMLAVPKIRVLGESLAASAAVTLLVAASWGYDRLDAPARLFPVLLYGFAALHALVLLAPHLNRARTWGRTASAFVLAAGLALTTAPVPHLWSLGLGAFALLLARFVTTPYVERFAALHLALAVLHALVSGDEFGRNLAADRYMISGFVALVVLTASTLLRTSYTERASNSSRTQTLRGVVWFVALAALGLITIYGVLAAGPDTHERLVLTGVGFLAAAVVFRVPPREAANFRRIYAAGIALLALLQLGREAVLVPSARFVTDVLDAIGAGYLLLGAGLLLLGVSVLYRWIPTAFVGASCSTLGWGVLLATRLDEAFSAVSYPELFTIPASLAFFGAGFAALRPQALSSRAFLPGAFLVLSPSTLVVLDSSSSDLRFTLLVAGCILCLPPGFRFRLHVLVVPPGAVLLLLFVYRALGLLGDSWITLAIAAIALLVVGSLFEKMRDRIRSARTYLSALR